jgi:vacuolar-type H+-ATPase subunit H
VALPEDIHHAAEVLRSQEALLAEAREAAQRLREEAEATAKARLDQHELVKAAREQAQAILAQSQAQAQALLHQAEQDVATRRQELDQYSLALLRRLEANLTAQLSTVHGGIEGIVQAGTRGPGTAEQSREGP